MVGMCELSVVEARIAAVLAEHVCSYHGPPNGTATSYCWCGWSGGDYAAHVASVVAALPDIRIVDLIAERAEEERLDALDQLNEMRCINGSTHYCNVTYAEREQYTCDYAAAGAHYFDTPEAISALAVRAAGGQS